jgi:hypothetical protein
MNRRTHPRTDLFGLSSLKEVPGSRNSPTLGGTDGKSRSARETGTSTGAHKRTGLYRVRFLDLAVDCALPARGSLPRFCCRLRHSQGAFLLVSSLSFRHHTADIVRQRPAVSAGGKSANGQSKSQYSGIFSFMRPRASRRRAKRGFSAQPLSVRFSAPPMNARVLARIRSHPRFLPVGTSAPSSLGPSVPP